MAEELNKPAGAPKPAVQKSPESNVGNGDMANLIGNVGILIDSTIESVQGIITSVSSATGQLIEGVSSTINSDSVQGMITSVSTATGQLIDGVTSTINSEPVKDILQNVNSVSGQLIDGVTATLKSDQIQNSFQELGKLWTGLLENLNSTVASVSSGNVQSLFDNVSAGLGQLVGNVMSTTKIGGTDDRKREVKEIHFTQKEVIPEVKTPVPAPVAASTPAVASTPAPAPYKSSAPAPAPAPVVRPKI
ncbi:MAG: chlorosome envelope protein H [Chlorobiaceae bacterium]|nr:chlorosome envelope protein H [Chlorobiaceae bacterium]